MPKLPIEVTGSTIKIDCLVPDGQGIGVAPDGKKGFFWNALPGEIVTRYKITKNKSRYFEAIAEEISEPSTHRITPKDSCFLSTSPWQIMDYNYELEQKALLLEEIFRQNDLQSSLSEREEALQTVLTDGKDLFYRNKMEYSLYWNNEKQKIELAQHERGSHKKVPLETSSIERPEIFAAAQKIVAELNTKHEEARKYQSLLLRCNQAGKVEGGLYENKKPHPVFNNLTDTLLGQEYSYSPNGFFQINLPVYEMALKEIKKHITTDNVLDLYSGVGTIGLSVAHNKNLTLVECNKFAYKELVRNCKEVNLQSSSSERIENYKTGKSDFSPTSAVTTRTGEEPRDDARDERFGGNQLLPVLSNSEDALEYIAPDQTVILDPPRAGCDKKLIDKLLEVTPVTIIYLSCNPVTQARDVKLLLEKYKIEKVVPFNFFPRTPHLENLIILKKLS